MNNKIINALVWGILLTKLLEDRKDRVQCLNLETITIILQPSVRGNWKIIFLDHLLMKDLCPYTCYAIFAIRDHSDTSPKRASQSKQDWIHIGEYSYTTIQSLCTPWNMLSLPRKAKRLTISDFLTTLIIFTWTFLYTFSRNLDWILRK